MKIELKTQLYKHCVAYIKTHIEINSSALSNAQEAVNEETKNTAADKYETTRAMKQLETEAFGRRLDEALAQQQVLKKIDISQPCDTVKPGALVYTSFGNFFIAISADEITIDGEEYSIVSIESPIGQAIANRAAGSTISFRGKTLKIFEIY